MRRFVPSAGCVLTAFLLLPGSLRAQEAAPYRVAPDFAAPPLVGDRLVVAGEEAAAAWRTDLIFGLPTGVRVSVGLSQASAWLPELEGFAGLYLILPTAGTGLRWSLPALRGEQDVLMFRPGIDAYVLANPFTSDGGWFDGSRRGFGLVAATIDCVWQHRFDRRWCAEFGLEIGAGPLFNSRSSVVIPVAGAFLGFRY